MSNSVSDGGAAGPYLDNIEIREGDEEQLLDIVSLGEKVFMSSWNEQMVATSMYGTYDTVLTERRMTRWLVIVSLLHRVRIVNCFGLLLIKITGNVESDTD